MVGQQFLQPGLATEAAAYLLDTYSATAAYSTRQLRTGQTNALRLRRDSDNAEKDFGFDGNGDLDTAAISTWLGGASGYVATWDDQSGNGNDATQATAGSQPLYVASGIGSRPSMTYSTDFMSVSSLAIATPFTAAVAMSITSVGIILEHSTDAGSNDGHWVYGTVNDTLRVRRATISSAYDYTSNWSLGGAKLIQHKYNGHADHILRVNGSEVSLSAEVADDPSGSATKDLYIMSRAGSSLFSAGDLGELIIFDTAISGGDASAIDSDINDYWSIY